MCTPVSSRVAVLSDNDGADTASSCATLMRSTLKTTCWRWPTAKSLRVGELYFVMSKAMLAQPLSSINMGRLAVRASVALAGERPQ